jgi:hypothetical protein
VAAQPRRDFRQVPVGLDRRLAKLARDVVQLRQDVAKAAARENGTSEILRSITASPGDLQSAVRLGRAVTGFRSAVLDTGGRES